MMEDCQIYPDMPSYHSAAVTLGHAGFLKELLKIIECMGEKPAKRIKNMRHKNWDPILQSDVAVFNAGSLKKMRSGEAPKVLTYKCIVGLTFTVEVTDVWWLTHPLPGTFQFLSEPFGRKVKLMKLLK
ncbi:unnamed protein product [Camellia sinensis]